MVCFDIFYYPWPLVQGLLVGLVFGFLLQKARLSKADVILGQFILKDFTMFKVLLTSIIVGGPGLYLIGNLLNKEAAIDPFSYMGLIVGAIFFGVGMNFLGYCPGSAIAAAGEGVKDAWFGILGIVAGIFVYCLLFTWIIRHVISIGFEERVLTIPMITGISSLIFYLILIGGAFWMFKLLKRFKL